MSKRKDKNHKDPLNSLVNIAGKDVLAELTLKLAKSDISIRRKCLDHLKDKVKIEDSVKRDAGSSAVLLLWYEVEPELAELDEYGGGDYSTQDDVSGTLYELSESLKKTALSSSDRETLLDEVVDYIKRGNAGMDDELYEVAYSACRNNDELRDLAGRFEKMGKDWPADHARRIYRQIGDREKYLRLRVKKMKYGMDYHDLATFYWDAGEREKAMDVAQKGMKVAEGRMDELRMFLAKRARNSGDRKTYLEYIFLQKTDDLTLSSYKEFKKECKPDEWAVYEPRILKLLDEKEDDIQSVKIRLHRKEHELALQYFQRPRRLSHCFYGESEYFLVAKELESRYPDQILSFYKSSVGNLNTSSSRKVYHYNAQSVERVRRMYVDVMNDVDGWKRYALSIKQTNEKRPAFQEIFNKVVRGWQQL
ncbi:MAG: hypothetical protein ABH871_03895 [Pseudomonadota bacterium]